MTKSIATTFLMACCVASTQSYMMGHTTTTTTTLPKKLAPLSSTVAVSPAPATTTVRRRSVKKRARGSSSLSSPGLTKAQEVLYTARIRRFRAAQRESGTKSFDKISEQGQAARSAVVAANVGLVTSIAQRLHHSLKQATEADHGVGTILTLQDMIQEGTLGLMEAAERFDPSRGVRFSTYATWWIRQRILRSVSDSSRIIRLPAHVHTMLMKMKRARAELAQEKGRPPTTPELADRLQVSPKKLQLYTDSSRNVMSLERPLRTASSYKEDSRTLGDVLASDAPTPQEDAEAASLQRDIRTVMNSLGDPERDVIFHRFGFGDGKPRSTAETAQVLDISRDRVRLLEAKALNKLRHPQTNYKLKDYVVDHTSSCTSQAAAKKNFRRLRDKCSSSSKISSDASRIWFF